MSLIPRLSTSPRDTRCYECEKREGRKTPWGDYIIYLCDECYWELDKERTLQELCEEEVQELCEEEE